MICDRPSKILVDSRQRLHAVAEPAMSFRDGYSIYVQHGALQDKDDTLLTSQDYLQEQNPRLHSVMTNIDNLNVQNASEADKLYPLRKTLLLDALERIMMWLEENARVIVAAFLPGLQSEEISSKLDTLPFKLSQEVHDLYRWRNGTQRELGLFVYHSFMPLDVALEYSEYLNNEELVKNRREGVPMYLFPIFDFDGEYFAVVGSDTVMETTPVYHVSDCFDCSLAFNSLSTMMLTIAESYEVGVYTSNSEVSVEWKNTRLFEEIRTKYNPGTKESLYGY